VKVLLVSVNASYMHTSLAIRDLKNYAYANGISPEKVQIFLKEYTINQGIGDVVRSIGLTEADLVLFSTYIWNAEYVCKLISDVKKVLPECIVGAGGPEFGYGAQKYLNSLPALDFVMFGEGEVTFFELLKTIIEGKKIQKVAGIYYRAGVNEVSYSGDRIPIQNLDDVPFPYPELSGENPDSEFVNHKIFYFESSRGCPFACAYCLSSVEKSVRFKSLERTCEELKIFLDANVPLVKFVDRTYNLNEERYLSIWQFILDNHNGKTMFHFEIEAEYLSDRALEFLKKVPAGVMQFEMGVQSANKKTLKSINRSENIEKLAENIRRIPRTIHQHLDLIAGLPFEDLASFGESYDYVMDLRPDALQLGFLKVLNGTVMEGYAKENGWQWMESPVYETFSTPYLSFKDVGFLKQIEILTDMYWNKGIFKNTFKYIFSKVSPWKFMCAIHSYAFAKGTFEQARRDAYWFELLSSKEIAKDFDELDSKLIYDLLRYDFLLTGKKGNFPSWYEHRYDKEKHRQLLEEKGLLNNSRIAFATTEFEVFDFDVNSSAPENHPGTFEVLIRYAG